MTGRWFAALLLVLLAMLALAGCSTLPPRMEPPKSPAFTDAETAGTPLGRIAAASLPAGAAPGVSGFHLLPDGEHAFDARIALAEAATRSIDAQYYHVHADTAGSAFLLALRDAAARGVRVRLLVDDFYAGDIYRLLRGLAAQPNAEVRLFNPLLVRYGTPIRRMLLSLREMARVNHRMHNKLFIADSQFAVFGGRNIADEYFVRRGTAAFLDLDVIGAGPVVQDLAASFDRYWNSEQAWLLEQRLHGWEKDLDAAERRADFVERLARLGTPALNLTPLDPLGVPGVRTQLAQGRLQLVAGRGTVHDDPPEKAGSPVVLNQPSAAMRGKLDTIAGARSEVVIVNPYLLPGELGLGMMRQAQARGTHVVIVTNSLGSTDEPLVHRAYSRFRVDMLKAGVQLYEFGPELVRRAGTFGKWGESTPRLHAKAAAVDRRFLIVGSVNLDARSALLNTELGVTIDSPVLAEQAIGLLRADAFRSMYRLQLAADGRSIQWHSRDDAGATQVQGDEPHANLWLDFSLWLQSLLVPEESL